MPMRRVVTGALCAAASVSGAGAHLRSASSAGMLAPKIVGELHNAENLVSQALKGQPDLAQKELQFLHGAEAAARDVEKSSEKREKEAKKRAQLLQQKDKSAVTMGTGMDKAMGELETAEAMAEKALKGHPKELKAEEDALHQAEAAARNLKGMKHTPHKVSALVEAKHASSDMSGADAEEVRSRLVAKSLAEERSFGAAERNLANDGKKVLSEFSNVEDAIASAFAGKNSSAIKTAMKAGELLEQAREKQQKVTDLNAGEATRAEKSAALIEAKMSAQNKEKQQQQEYIKGMSQLAKDEKAEVAEYDTVKSAVAQAFAGKDSKAVEKAMEVGELLDKARADQDEVADLDAKEASGAPKFFKHFSGVPSRDVSSPQHHSVPAVTALAQRRMESELRSLAAEHAAMEAKRATHLKSMVANEQHIVDETGKVEETFKRNFVAPTGAKAGAAVAMEKEVLAMLTNATKAEQRAHDATLQASQAAAKAAEKK